MVTGGNKSNTSHESAFFCPARYASASVARPHRYAKRFGQAGGCWSVVCLIEPSQAIPVSL